MGREDKAAWKANYFVKITELLDEYPRCFLVGVDNVGSKQMQEIRQAMRGFFSFFFQGVRIFIFQGIIFRGVTESRKKKKSWPCVEVPALEPEVRLA